MIMIMIIVIILILIFIIVMITVIILMSQQAINIQERRPAEVGHGLHASFHCTNTHLTHIHNDTIFHRAIGPIAKANNYATTRTNNTN